MALGMQLQLHPDNDPRSVSIRSLLRLLGEDPATAMRLANSRAHQALAAHAAAFTSAGGSPQQPPPPMFARRSHDSSGSRQPPPTAAAKQPLHSPSHSHSPSHASHLRSGAAGAAHAPGSPASPGLSGAGAVDGGQRGMAANGGRLAPPPDGARTPSTTTSQSSTVAPALAALLGESSYKSLRRASLKQLAQRMDTDDFSDVEDNVENYINGPTFTAVGSSPRRVSMGSNPRQSVSFDLAVTPRESLDVAATPRESLDAAVHPRESLDVAAAPRESSSLDVARGPGADGGRTGGSRRQSLQVDDEELVFWEPGQG
ncbi:hypothetical protein TSOC_000842 [Tetrabaena socialis]|uniref:Uncharacterized protein n=1 Tax=Tetrabaena socialis TaxID=47790 RepID=A0A2J8AIB7_9CHLO|nr:hypothetical protein TSOC_000842 [Tetrabaena socialis]|eukprot:PNH12256.1 hypothetical protein TSOC_000842 [Tetrabaena socialis]